MLPRGQPFILHFTDSVPEPDIKRYRDVHDGLAGSVRDIAVIVCLEVFEGINCEEVSRIHVLTLGKKKREICRCEKLAWAFPEGFISAVSVAGIYKELYADILKA